MINSCSVLHFVSQQCTRRTELNNTQDFSATDKKGHKCLRMSAKVSHNDEHWLFEIEL